MSRKVVRHVAIKVESEAPQVESAVKEEVNNEGKMGKMPSNWEVVYRGIETMRSKRDAPVDRCERCKHGMMISTRLCSWAMQHGM